MVVVRSVETSTSVMVNRVKTQIGRDQIVGTGPDIQDKVVTVRGRSMPRVWYPQQ